MIKILYIHSSLEIGGAEMLRLLSLKHINRDKYDIRVCCIESKGKIAEKIEAMGYEVTCLKSSSKPHNLLTTLSLFRYLKRNKFDIVQTSLFSANFHGRIAAILAGVPIIISEEHSEHYQYNSLKFMPYIFIDRFLASFTDRIICCSVNMLDAISKKERISKEKFIPLVNVIDPERFSNINERKTIRKKMGLLDSDIAIGNIASLSPRKGHMYLMKAFAKIRASFPNSRLFIIGKEHAETKDRLLKLKDELGLLNEVFFLGERHDALDLLSAMDLFVLSSIHEGIPLVILEALYLGIPAISTDVGGISEVITNNMDGLLVPAKDCGSLGYAITELLQNPEKRQQFSKRGKHTILTKFMPERYIKQLDNLYQELCANKAKCAAL